MMKKRWLSLILVLALCLCLLPAGASAAEAPDETVTISYTLTDSFGDGWSSASIQIKEMSSGATVAELTVSNGSSSTGTVDLTVGTTYQFIWNRGSYDSECSYVFQNGSTVILEGAGGNEAGTLLTWTAVPPASISVTVGDGSAARQYVPTNSLYNYSKSQVLVPAAELSALAGRSITGITYYPAAGSHTRTLAVLLSETEAESMTALLDASSDTEVFAGSVSFQKNEEAHLAFDTPYPYQGGNLLVTVMDNTGSWQSGLQFYGVDQRGFSWSCVRDDSPIARSETGNGSTDRYFLPKMTFTAVGDAPLAEYDLWIAGVQVTSANAEDLTAIPGVSVEQGGEARYDPESNTLTLSGAHINNTLANPGEEKLNCGIYYDETEALNISVTGSNTVTSRAVASGDSRYETCGLWLYSYAALNVTLSSGATLSILGGGSAVNSASYGLEVNGPLTVSGSGELICNGGSAEAGTSIGIGAVNDITIGDGCSVSANCGTAAYSRGLYLIGTSRTIRLTGSAELNCSGGSGTNSYGVWYLPSLFSSGTLTLSAPDWTGAMTVTGQTKAMHAEEHAGTLARTVSQMDMTGYVESDGTALSEASYNINEDLSGYKLISFAPTPVTTYDLYVAGVQVTSANAEDLSVIDGVTLGAEGYAKYYSTNNTLTIKNATITNSTAGEYGFGIQYTGTGTFTLEAIGTNTVSVTGTQTTSSAAVAVGTPGIYSFPLPQANLRVYLLDDATLNLSSGRAEGGYYPSSYGIANAYDGQVTVTGAGTVNATGGAAEYSYGAHCGGEFYKTGTCALNAAGADAALYSYGIYCGDNIIITGGKLSAVGGTSAEAGAESYGIMGDTSSGDTITIAGGAEVLAKGNTAALHKAPTMDSGVTAGGSASYDGSGAVAYVPGDNGLYCWFAAPFTPPAPGPIETVTADASPGRVRLSWTAAENATAYLIQRRTADSTVWTTLRSGITNTAWSDTSGAAGTVYQYRVRPMNGSIYGSFRASSVVRFLSGEAPAPVENVTATAQAGRIVITWAEAQNAEQYLVQRRVKDTEEWTTLRSNVTGLRYEDTTGEENAVYQYRVRGRSGTLYGPFRVSSVARFYLYETPGSISSVTTKAEGGRITVSWTAAEDAAQYIIQRRVKGDAAWTTLKSNVAGLSYEDAAGEPGVVYQYRVRGRNHTVYGPFRVSSVVRYPQPNR